MAETKNWTVIAQSKYPWEQEALDFVRDRFPAYEPFRAWSNFEFIAEDGSVNEVDLLVFTPHGFFLVEIKSKPGRLRGDAGTWIWETDGKLTTVDNPYQLANYKAKKLRSLLQRQKACKGKGQVPFIEAVVFCSAPGLQCELQGTARQHVYLRDRYDEAGKLSQPGIASLISQSGPNFISASLRESLNRPTAKMVAQAIEQAGVRPSQRSRKVGDYVLEQLIDEGPGYQDWQATHATLQSARRRVRIYNVRRGATHDERQTIERAAKREAELLEALQHPGILRREGYTEHELGPALIFEHDPKAIRLDHFLAQSHDKLTVDQRLDLLRQIAEAVRFAHEKGIVHRALCPQSILVSVHDGGLLRIKIFNWQLGYRSEGSTSNASRAVSATSHVERLVDDASTAYMAPEAISEDNNLGEHLDIFSLGAIAYHLFAGAAPAANGLELSNKLRETKGLQISSVMNGASESLQELIQWSTLPVVADRTGVVGSVNDFLDLVEKVEDEATAPDPDRFAEDPKQAKKDDLLPGGFRVIRRLGLGGCSVVLLVEKDGNQLVLKVANDAAHNDRLRGEAETLLGLRHNHIVAIVSPGGTLEIGDRFAFLMHPVFANREERKIETLRDRLRNEGRLHVDLLQRFGEDLLDVVKFLEEEAGVPHRDIKPDNIAIGQIKRGDKLHLVLFDFSLSRVPAENLRAGTNRYLDPFLPLRQHKRWDLHAERFAAAMTLYELATGPNSFPKWGDGSTEPSHLACEVTIDGELFDASLRDNLSEFFFKAFRRNPQDRFDNAEQMLSAWRDCFVGIEEPGSLSDQADDSELRRLVDSATFDTHIAELGLGTRAANALDRANILTVDDLLTVPMRRLLRLRGVGNKTRREIAAAVRILRDRLGTPRLNELPAAEPDPPVPPLAADTAALSVDHLLARISRVDSRDGDTASNTMQALLGLDPRLGGWPSQSDIAPLVEVSRGRIGQIVGKLQSRWADDAALAKLRTDLVDILTTAGGVMTVAELAEAILIGRGSVQDEPRRSVLALAVARACTEAERTVDLPRFQVRRNDGRVFVALSQDLANYAARLGEVADKLASEDPLVPPARVLQKLREIAVPDDGTISDTRLVRLAAAASTLAAVSSRQELYTRGLDAARALKLSQGAVYGVPFLTVEHIRERVRGRYPEAAALPDRPALDALLQEAGLELKWGLDSKGTPGYYSSSRDSVSVTSGSEPPSRLATASGDQALGEITPEIADARQFEERLQRGIREGSFLALMVNPKCYQCAMQELCKRFPVELVDVEGVFIDALQEVATKAGAKWEAVVNADAEPGSESWKKFLVLVQRAMPIVEQRLSTSTKTMLLTYSGLLARYDQMPLLERLREKVGRRDGIPGVWLLIPGDHQPMLDGKAVPVISPGQRTRIPESWLRNMHRGKDIHHGGTESAEG